MNNNKRVVVIDGVHYKLSPADLEQLQTILSRACVVKDSKAPQVKPVAEPVVAKKESTTHEKLTNAVVARLVGYDVQWGYNFETNSYLDFSYRDTMHDGYVDRALVSFKREIEKIPEFSNYYELSAAVTMQVKDSEVSESGLVSNPQHDPCGTVGLGNIIARNKNTGRLELYSPSWVVCNGGYKFVEAGFQALLIRYKIPYDFMDVSFHALY